MKREFNWDHIIQYYGHKLHLKKRGNSYIALSPFTNEKKASFVITPDKDIWKDFSSGRGGKGPQSFIKEIEGLENWREVHEFIYKQYGIISDYLLKTDPKIRGRNYLENIRHLSYDTIKYFDLRFNVKKNCISVPLHDENGSSVGFVYRSINHNNEMRYWCKTGTEKGKHLYNLNRVNKFNDIKSIILTEGFFQTFWLYQNGYPNVVSSMGVLRDTGITNEQKKLLIRKSKEGIKIKIFFDGDEAGYKAADVLENYFKKQKVNVENLRCPEGKQPDELDKKTLDELLKSNF